MLSELQKRQFERAEQQYLREPEYPEDHIDEDDECCKKCELCEEYPVDDMLYNKDGEWICVDCLLDKFQKKDVYTGEVFERRA